MDHFLQIIFQAFLFVPLLKINVIMKNNFNELQAVWNKGGKKSAYPPLTENLTADVAIVGAGITGLSTAYRLAKAGKTVAILEQDQVGMGTTGFSTGNLYAPVSERLAEISRKHDEQTMREVVNSRVSAITFIEDRVSEFQLDCDFQRVPWHLFTTVDSGESNEIIQKEYQALRTTGLTINEEVPEGFPVEVGNLLTLPDQAQINPFRYVEQLAGAIADGNCKIYENTKVIDVKHGKPCTVETTGGRLTAENVVMATHTPKGIYAVHAAMRTFREFAYGVRVSSELPKPGVYWHLLSGNQYSIRPYWDGGEGYLLVLGGEYNVGDDAASVDSFKKLESYLHAHFDVKEVGFLWAAQNYKPADNLPYIGSGTLHPHIYIATGFSADGLVFGTLAGMIIGDSILDKKNPWTKLYAPGRFTPVASAGNVLKENVAVVGHLLKDYLFYGEVDELKEIKPGEGKTVKIDGEHLAAFRDETGEIHLVSGVCTHMGCIVNWNSVEKSWDCPCHGSRFSVEGEVLEGPAYKALAKPKASLKNQ